VNASIHGETNNRAAHAAFAKSRTTSLAHKGFVAARPMSWKERRRAVIRLVQESAALDLWTIGSSQARSRRAGQAESLTRNAPC
jgi:hypothetical protein